MEVITCVEKRAIEKYAIETIGIPSIVLMENAALQVVNNLDLDNKHSFTIVSGVGNNGGDGLAIARHLLVLGKKVDVFIIGNIKKGTLDFNTNYNILKNMQIPIINIRAKKDLYSLKDSLDKNDITIDSIFGLGLRGDIQGLYFELISFVNNYSKEIVSIDIPSGLQCDTGNISSIAIKADTTITFHKMKIGMLDRQGYTGQIIVVAIGLPEDIISRSTRS